MNYQQSTKDNNTVFWIEISKISPNPNQPRKEFNEEQLKELAESIKQYGILQPLLVVRREEENENGTNVHYELIAGERRLRAAKLAGLSQAPVIIRKEPAERVKLELALIENVQREDLNSIEKAIAFKRLSEEFKMKHSEIAKKIGKSRVHVTNTIRILNLPEEMKQAISEGRISEAHGRSLLMLAEKPEDQQMLYKDILYQGLNTREAEKISRRIAYHKARKQEGLPFNEETRILENQLTNLLGTRVFIDRQGDNGKIMIDFNSVSHLKNLFELIAKAKEKNIFNENGFTELKETLVGQEESQDEKPVLNEFPEIINALAVKNEIINPVINSSENANPDKLLQKEIDSIINKTNPYSDQTNEADKKDGESNIQNVLIEPKENLNETNATIAEKNDDLNEIIDEITAARKKENQEEIVIKASEEENETPKTDDLNMNILAS